MPESRLALPLLRKGAPPSAAPEAAPEAADRWAVARGRISGPQRIVIYGPGGVGKSTLAALAPAPIFIDVEEGTRELDVARIRDVKTWSDLRACLQSSALDGYRTVVIDTMTRAEELAVAHTLATVKHEKGHAVTSLEGYGFGKGLQHVYDTFLHLMADLDSQIRRGRNVLLICHDCTADVPNPAGDDYIRFEPHLQAPKSGRASIRNRVVQWADHVLFIGYDVVGQDGKGKGGGTRTVWTYELPDHIAKSRTAREALPFESPQDGAIWDAILAQGGGR
jgi:hypothetical protein